MFWGALRVGHCRDTITLTDWPIDTQCWARQAGCHRACTMIPRDKTSTTTSEVPSRQLQWYQCTRASGSIRPRICGASFVARASTKDWHPPLHHGTPPLLPHYKVAAYHNSWAMHTTTCKHSTQGLARSHADQGLYSHPFVRKAQSASSCCRSSCITRVYSRCASPLSGDNASRRRFNTAIR